ncbi:hypothetical protein CR513_32296, partial [Mucuna pruriens]
LDLFCKPENESISTQKEHLGPEEALPARTNISGTNHSSMQGTTRDHRKSKLGNISNSAPLYALDPEIDKTFHRLRKIGNTIIGDNSSSDSILNSKNSNFATNESHFSEYLEKGSMEKNDRTLKELTTPDVVYQPWCIWYPQLEPAQTYELKSSLIHLLPKFHGLAGEDPHKHLKEFHVVCSTMRLQGIPEDYIKMKAFPFSLDGATKDCLYL